MTERSPSALKIRLMQIREDPVTMEEEFQEFCRYGQLGAHQLNVLDVFKTPEFGAEAIAGFDALFIGGSSDATVLDPKQFPFIESCQKLLIHAVEQSFPVFASCFGFQLLVSALGGQIIRDRPNLEMGVYALSLTPEAHHDRLFKDLPNPFLAISGHQERASCLPPELVNLAFSQKCPYHAIKVKGKPIYGFQFHPEVDAHDLKQRILRYQTRYLDDAAQIQTILASLQETHDANQLIRRFIDRVLLPS